MLGMNRYTGKEIGGLEHLKQSIIDILTTPLGSRVMRRNYGCRLHDFIDAPLNQQTIAAFYAAVADALVLWEPRFRLQQITLKRLTQGTASFELKGIYLPEQQVITLKGIEV
ncbi:GPW/gp25 family protein [Zooshikella sp. RANM57]|uniref:GPW/gp25 family protein n=1 Tax=Zooshikella sp. RANM57 TaxID=3425863 RepID=UPI003D6FFEC8